MPGQGNHKQQRGIHTERITKKKKKPLKKIRQALNRKGAVDYKEEESKAGER